MEEWTFQDGEWFSSTIHCCRAFHQLKRCDLKANVRAVTATSRSHRRPAKSVHASALQDGTTPGGRRLAHNTAPSCDRHDGDQGVSAESPLIAARNETQRRPRPRGPRSQPRPKTKVERVGAESEAPANNAVTSRGEKGAFPSWSTPR